MGDLQTAAKACKTGCPKVRDQAFSNTANAGFVSAEFGEVKKAIGGKTN